VDIDLDVEEREQAEQRGDDIDARLRRVFLTRNPKDKGGEQ
jgi:hypothetical protein